MLDTSIDEELESEGWARDRIREIQNARRADDLDVSDRISLTVRLPERWKKWWNQHQNLIASEVLAVKVHIELVDPQHQEYSKPCDTAVQSSWHDLGEGIEAHLDTISV